MQRGLNIGLLPDNKRVVAYDKSHTLDSTNFAYGSWVRRVTYKRTQSIDLYMQVHGIFNKALHTVNTVVLIVATNTCLGHMLIPFLYAHSLR